MTASNFWDYLTKTGEVDCHIFPTSWLNLRPYGMAVPIMPIRTGEEILMITIALPILPGVLPPTPVLPTFQGVLDVHTPPDAMSATISFAAGVRIIHGVNLIAAAPWSIPRFVDGVNTGMVR